MHCEEALLKLEPNQKIKLVMTGAIALSLSLFLFHYRVEKLPAKRVLRHECLGIESKYPPVPPFLVNGTQPNQPNRRKLSVGAQSRCPQETARSELMEEVAGLLSRKKINTRKLTIPR
jgi:hypothetical protein